MTFFPLLGTYSGAVSFPGTYGRAATCLMVKIPLEDFLRSRQETGRALQQNCG